MAPAQTHEWVCFCGPPRWGMQCFGWWHKTWVNCPRQREPARPPALPTAGPEQPPLAQEQPPTAPQQPPLASEQAPTPEGAIIIVQG